MYLGRLFSTVKLWGYEWSIFTKYGRMINKYSKFTLTLSVTVVTALDNHPKFQFYLRRDHRKNSYERRAYESLDDNSLS